MVYACQAIAIESLVAASTLTAMRIALVHKMQINSSACDGDLHAVQNNSSTTSDFCDIHNLCLELGHWRLLRLR